MVNLFLPSDIFGSLMFLVNHKNMTFHDKIIDLVYKLMFYGLKNIDFSYVSYFSLVFASQMLVLEYYNEHTMLGTMLSFFFYKFLVFYVIQTFDLTFETLFESQQVSDIFSEDENDRISYCFKRDLKIEKILTFVNYRVIDLINQIMFCRSKIMDELMKLKVVERIHQKNPPTKEELKKRFFKIEELGERNLFNLLMMIQKNKKNDFSNMKTYNNMSLFKNYLIGKNIYNLKIRFKIHERI